MKINFSIILATIFLVVFSCEKDTDSAQLDVDFKKAIELGSRTGDINYFVMPESHEYDKLPNQDPHNPITKDKIELGKMLFFETGLGQNPKNINGYETYSCSSCHVPRKGFLPGRAQGIADGGVGFGDYGSTRDIATGYDETTIDAQGNRPLTVMNVTYVTNTLWSGLFGANDLNVGTESKWVGLADVNHTGYAGLEAQNIEGFDLHRLEINDRVLNDFGYGELFDKVFTEFPQGERYSPTTASFAMGAYLRSLLTNQAPFQDYLKGQSDALTDNQKKGGILFFGKAGCINCHKSPSFSAMRFYALGTQDMYENGGLNTSKDDVRILGRGMFTGEDEDMFKFKVPQLYNLKDYVSFFHGSSKTTIEEVVDFKLAAVSENPFVSDNQVQLTKRTLSTDEKANLIDFLTNALHDDDMERYMPESVLSGFCFPDNDKRARKDIGCD